MQVHTAWLTLQRGTNCQYQYYLPPARPNANSLQYLHDLVYRVLEDVQYFVLYVVNNRF